MKKIYTLLLLGVAVFVQAQVPNRSFEEWFNGGNTIKNWGSYYMAPLSTDPETGEIICAVDTIAFVNGTDFSFPVGDCLSGNVALAITNAWNVNKNQVVPGTASLYSMEFTDLPEGWNNGIPVAQDANIQFLGFNYKFFPVGEDVAQAKLELLNWCGVPMGRAIIDISQPKSEFEYVYAPMEILSPNDIPGFLTIEFSMAKEGSIPNLGSQLIVDDVIVNSVSLGVSQNTASKFTVYPTVADNEINITKNMGFNQAFDVKIVDLNGKIIKSQKFDTSDNAPVTINVSDLSQGLYFLHAETDGSKPSVTKFIKK